MSITKRVEHLEKMKVENTNSIEEFEYLLLTDYSVRADSFLIENDTVNLYTGNQFEDIELIPSTFNTTTKEMKNLLLKYNFNELALS